jgi:hypothetical protein
MGIIGANVVVAGQNDFDAACTRDNLGRLFEMKGDFSKSREWRTRVSETMVCSHFDVSFLVLFTYLKYCLFCRVED